MKVQLEHILQNLFHKPSLEEVNVYELEQMVKEHPYFSTGHYLLAQKLKHENGEHGEQQSQRAALYFHDPLWLQWQLKQFSNGHAVEAKEPGAHVPLPLEEPVEKEVVFDQEEEPRELEQPVKQEEPEQRIDHEQPLEPEEQLAVETIGPVEEAIPAEPEIEAEQTAKALESASENENSSPADEIQSLHESAPAPPVADEPKASEPSKPVIQKEDPPLVFEAYHTIDYFASQGIKPMVEVQPGDKLGKQLKSFTEWLKTMKRLPQTQIEAITDESEQQHIRQAAAESLEQKEVVTETMAEVLVKQGKNAEAIAIYEKLSLLDPSKSAFFAAKIENLKAN